MRTLDLIVISDDKFDPAMWFNSALIPGDLGVLNVKSMVRAIKKACGRDGRIGSLTIVGHGNEYGQEIGADWVTDQTVHQFAGDLFQLQPLFAPGSRVTMAGCRVGRAKPLLIELAHIFGVPVEGYSRLQITPPPIYQGERTTCFITCTSEKKTVVGRALDSADDGILAVREFIENLYSGVSQMTTRLFQK